MKRNRIGIIMVAVFASGLLVGMTDAGGQGGPQALNRARRAPATFTASGIYSGPLSGTVLIGDKTVEIPDGVMVQQVGKGDLGSSPVVNSAGVLAAGMVQNGKLVASMVLVAAPPSGRDFSQETQPNVLGDPKAAN